MSCGLSDINGRSYDVAVIGGGATGASAAQNLASRGYDTLLVDKGDFGSGTSSRSSRLLYCGLAHLSPDYPMWKFILRPFDLARRLRMAVLAMSCRAQLVRTMPERLNPYTFFFPIYRHGQYPGWKVDAGFRALEALGVFRVSLKYRRLGVEKAAKRYGLARLLAEREDLSSIAAYREYQYDWPERICVDTILDAERLGCTSLNYARVTKLESSGDDGWNIGLEDALMINVHATVKARKVINCAGPWVDQVNGLSERKTDRHLTGVKGVNVVVRLPDDCRGQGLETISSIDQPFYCMPWGKYHFFGPTETIFDGDPDDARVETEEIDFILDQANRLFPSLGLTRDDVVYSWCGIRPRTAGANAKVIKTLTLHDLGEEGLPGILAPTGVPIMNHRYAGSIIAKRIARKMSPGAPARPLSHAAKCFPDNANSPALDPEFPQVCLADLRHAASHEKVRTLTDLMFRRTQVGWTPPDMGLGVALRVAEEVADILGWDTARVKREVASYEAFVRSNFNPTIATATASTSAQGEN